MNLQLQSMQQACFLKGLLPGYKKHFNSLYLPTEIWGGILIIQEYEKLCMELFSFINVNILNVIQEKLHVLCSTQYIFQVHDDRPSNKGNILAVG